MLDNALELLREIESHGYLAYIVGGAVRDYIMGVESHDIDICTNATPMEVKEIYTDSCLSNEEYGSVTVYYNNIRFEITTFRKEYDYVDKRRPSKIKYIDSLYDDLLRRDFTINAICMDSSGNIIDYLGGRDDINNKIIRCIGSSLDSFNNDALRILRAVRFACCLNFKLSDDVYSSIGKTKSNIRSLSYYRKRYELDRIFASNNRDYGIKLLIRLGLDRELELNNLSKLVNNKIDDLIGIWAILDNSNYIFNKNEKELIKKINIVRKYNNYDPYILYKYGLYVNSVAGKIKGEDIKKITDTYNKLPIKDKSNINISSYDIMKIVDKKYINKIYMDIEKKILYNELDNSKDKIIDYIKDNYVEVI